MSYELSGITRAHDLPALMSLEASAASADQHPALGTIASWVTSYLCCPHAELGRSGPVCPFVPGALQKQLLFAVVHEDDDLDVSAIKAILLREMKRFIDLAPTSGNEAQFKSVMVVFPELPADKLSLIEARKPNYRDILSRTG